MVSPAVRQILLIPNYVRRYGVVEHWALSEASGAAVASISSANNLTDNNTVTSNPGKVYGTARQFTAANSEYLSLADNAAVSMGAGVRMMGCAWVYLDTTGTDRSLVAKFLTTGNQREWIVEYAGAASRFTLSVSAAGASTITATANTFGAPSTVTWYFLCWYYDGATIGISVNGGTFDTTAFTADIFDGTADFNIGSFNNGAGEYGNGRIGPVTLCKNPPLGVAALKTEFRDRMYNGGNGRQWPFR